MPRLLAAINYSDKKLWHRSLAIKNKHSTFDLTTALSVLFDTLDAASIALATSLAKQMITQMF